LITSLFILVTIKLRWFRRCHCYFTTYWQSYTHGRGEFILYNFIHIYGSIWTSPEVASACHCGTGTHTEKSVIRVIKSRTMGWMGGFRKVRTPGGKRPLGRPRRVGG